MKLFTWYAGLEAQFKAVAALVLIGLLVIVAATAFHFVDAAFEEAETKGAAIERTQMQGKAIENVEKANAAAAKYRTDPLQRDAECLRDARNPEDC